MWSEPVLIALIGAIATTLVAILGFLGIVYRDLKAVKKATDGMTDRLVGAAFKDGQDDGKILERATTRPAPL